MRAFDPAVHHVIANHPDVVRNLGWNPDEQGFLLFCDQIVETDRYVFLHNGDRELSMADIQAGAEMPGLAMVFEWTSPATYAMHTMALPSFRGKRVIAAAKALIHEMFTVHGAENLWGHTPIANRAARMFNRLVGAKSYGVRDQFAVGESEVFYGSRETWLLDNMLEEK